MRRTLSPSRTFLFSFLRSTVSAQQERVVHAVRLVQRFWRHRRGRATSWWCANARWIRIELRHWGSVMSAPERRVQKEDFSVSLFEGAIPSW
uniref:Putative secreted protein n=1 Tax=Ixodes ricinus TaxID=34613 RepID=A0A6B0U7U3_IXORI